MKHTIRGGDSASAPPGIRTASARRLTAGAVATVLGLGLSLTGLPAAHAAETYFCPDNTQPYAPVAEVEAFSAGTAVTGLSVTQGTAPDAFTGTYIGYIADELGKGKDLLLFRLSSPVIDGTGAGALKPAGIWAGMSGSPVYTTDGRLIGAVSESLNADNLPIAGVTPAAYMKTIGTTALGTSAKVKVTSSNLRTTAAGLRIAGTSLVGSTLSPVRTVNLAGPAGARQNAFTNRTLARTPSSAKAAGTLRSRTFLAAAGQSDSVPASLVPGGNIFVSYTSGDLEAGALGTVTAVCGSTVWAFGHPMDFTGEASLLMANASAAMIVPDGTGVYGSYKQVSQIGAPVGMITQDRLVGVRGTLGATHTFGVGVDVQNASGTKVASYRMDVADPEIAASAVAVLVGQAAAEQLDQHYAGTAQVTWTVDYQRANGDPGTFTNTQFAEDPSAFSDLVATYPAQDVYTITSNEFEDVSITGVQVTLKLLSANAVSYKTSGVQVQGKAGAWTSLAGAKLKAGSSYQLRPQYVVRTNGRAGATIGGDPFTVKLSSKARKSGSFAISATADSTQVCDQDANTCDDWQSDDTDGSFDDVLAALEGEVPYNLVDGVLRYKLKSGSTIRPFSLAAPGVVTGTTKVSFTIK